MAALMVLLCGCTRPQGTTTLRDITASPSPAGAHEPLTITDVAMHNGEVGLAFAPITLAATGGVTPYRWTVSVGSLPAGLALSPEGVISGTPTSNGFFQFGVQVFDADSDTAGLPRTIGIVPQLTAALVPACATECDVELGCVTVCGAFGQVSGGASPLTYKLTSGPLPSGTSLSGMSLKGTFTGLPGRLSFTVQVTDGFGVTASLTPTFNMIPHISLLGGKCQGVNGNCTVQLQYMGGTPGKLPSLNVSKFSPNCPPTVGCAPPPKQFSAVVSAGLVTVTAMQVTPPSIGTYLLTLTDQNLCAAGTYCSSQPVTLNIDVYSG
jgi:hypothetical protein